MRRGADPFSRRRGQRRRRSRVSTPRPIRAPPVSRRWSMRCCAGLPATRRLISARALAATPTRRTRSPIVCAPPMARSVPGRILAAHRLDRPTDFSVKGAPERWAERVGGVVLPTGSVRCARLAGPVPEAARLCRGRVVGAATGGRAAARLFGDVKGLAFADLSRPPAAARRSLPAFGALVTAVELLGQPSDADCKPGSGAAAARRVHHPAVYTRMAAAEPLTPFCWNAPVRPRYGSPPSRNMSWTKTPADIENSPACSAACWTVPCGLRPARRADRLLQLLARSAGGRGIDPDLPGRDKAVAADPIHAGELPGTADLSRRGFLRTTPADLVLPDPALSGVDGFFAAGCAAWPDARKS